VQAHALAGINRAKYAALRRLYSGLKLMTLLAVGLVGLAALASVVGTARKVAKASARGAKILGTAERIDNVGVKEPSGIAFYPPTGHFFVVGDEGAIAELDDKGHPLKTTKIEAQIEDVTVHTPSGALILVSESRSELVLFDPASGQERKRWPIDLASVLGTGITEHNQGFEGVAFRPEEGQPGGGIFYLTHQRSPSLVVALKFDPMGPARRLTGDDVVSRWPLTYEGLTAITWAEPLGRLLVIADEKDRLLVIRPEDGAVESEIPIPGRQQEGVALDPSGGLWIADDLDKCVLHIKDALSGLQAQLHAPPESEDLVPSASDDDDKAAAGKGKSKGKKKKEDLLSP